MNVLGIGLDYLMLQEDKVRGDVRARQIEYAQMVGRFDLIVHSPKEADMRPTRLSENLKVSPTNFNNKIAFIIDAWKAASDICRREKIDVITVEDAFTTGLVGCLLKRRFRIPLNMERACFTNVGKSKFLSVLREGNSVDRVGNYIQCLARNDSAYGYTF